MRAEPEAWQIEALSALVTDDRIAIRSGHGVGKSAFMAWVVLWWLCTRFPAKIACTAPTAHQLEDVLWGEIAKWHRQMAEPYRGWLSVGSGRVEQKDNASEAFAVARTARKEQPEAFQGFHSDNMLFIVDEASGVEDIIFEVGQGAMSTEGAKTLMAGNPTRTSGYFYDAFHKMRARWRTFRVSCKDSTRVAPGYADEIADQYGPDSNVYRVRVEGEFPLEDDDAVIPLHLCEGAIIREVEMSERTRPVWGLDPARFGDDRTALCKRHVNCIYEPVRFWRGKDTMQTAGMVKLEYDQTPEHLRPSNIYVDVIGLGAGVVDRLNEMGLPVSGINVGEAPSIRERFMRRRDELWFQAREWLEARDCRIPDQGELIAELTAPKYKLTSSGKVQVESKDEMKKRGIPSPDLADAFCLTLAGDGMPIEQHEIDRYARRGRKRSTNWMAA